MSIDTLRPRVRAVESFPVSHDGEYVYALRDPQGFSSSIVIPYPAAVLVSLMDGSRSLPELQKDFQEQAGQRVELADIKYLLKQLDERYYLDNGRFRELWKASVETYLNSPIRPAAHAGGAYFADADALRKQLGDLFSREDGPGFPVDNSPVDKDRLCGVLSPHIDLHRGGATFAWAYKKVVEESDADLFVIFGTAHQWMSSLFSVSKKHFETPLGRVETDTKFISTLLARLAAQPAGKDFSVTADELAHRHEHSIEFQVVFLQYLLGGRRPFKVVPVLTGSFHEFVHGATQPSESPQVQAFVNSMQATARAYAGKICYICGGDLAHIGRRFGDRWLLDSQRLESQLADDRQLLQQACRGDAHGFFSHVAAQQDCNRICGLSPTYTMLQVMQPMRRRVPQIRSGCRTGRNRLRQLRQPGLL